MPMAASRSLLVGMMMMSGISLGACNRDREADVLANDPFAVNATAKGDQFGKGFGKAFRADPNSEPANLAQNDVVPVSTTAEPIDFN